jgi:hypothetical protein
MKGMIGSICDLLLFCLGEPRWHVKTFQHAMRFFCQKVIFESISSNGHISSLVSTLKHGTKEDVMSVHWILKYLAIGHEEVTLQLFIKVGREKVFEAVKLWEEDLYPDAMVKPWLKHGGIARSDTARQYL